MTEDKSKDDYLWNPDSKPDPEIEALENILSPLRSKKQDLAPTMDRISTSPRRARSRWMTPVRMSMAAAGILFAVICVWQFSGTSEKGSTGDSGEDNLGEEIAFVGKKLVTPALDLIVSSSNRHLKIDEVIEPTEDEELVLAKMGEITVVAGSRLRVQRLEEERTRLFLEYGRIRALIYLDVKPRFFEVGTPATTCVDLGCEYDLEVSQDGVATVVVRLGQVAFVDGGREIFVPQGATCTADKIRGAGVPRFEETPRHIVRMLDRFEKLESKARVVAAKELLKVIEIEEDWRHTLLAWHLLQDKTLAVAAEAALWLNRNFDKPESIASDGGRRLTAAEIEAWKEVLRANW